MGELTSKTATVELVYDHELACAIMYKHGIKPKHIVKDDDLRCFCVFDLSEQVKDLLDEYEVTGTISINAIGYPKWYRECVEEFHSLTSYLDQPAVNDVGDDDEY